MTEEIKRENILKVLEENFEASTANGINIPVFFTDAFDLGKEYDKTTV